MVTIVLATVSAPATPKILQRAAHVDIASLPDQIQTSAPADVLQTPIAGCDNGVMHMNSH